MKTVCIIGLGYIGLPTAAVMCEGGACVIGVDIDDRVVTSINRGETHIVEPYLDIAIKRAVTGGRLKAQKAIPVADAYVIAVPTPVLDSKAPDMSYVEAAFRSVAPALRKGATVVLESTSPVGTTDRMVEFLAAERPDLVMPEDGKPGDIAVAYCPERVLPGNALHELIANDRIIGGVSPQCTAMGVALYRIFVKGQLLESNARTAEMAKLVENAYRDVNIAFANELSLVSAKAGVDVWELIKLANHHPRVKILQPGPGVGGHCIAVDPWFLIHDFPAETPLMRVTRKVNDGKPDFVIDRIWEKVDAMKLGRKPVIGCLGLSFKPNIDDLRASPALEIATRLAESRKARVLAVEPHVKELKPNKAGIELIGFDDCLTEADVIVGLVAHSAFAGLDPQRLLGKGVLDFVSILPKMR